MKGADKNIDFNDYTGSFGGETLDHVVTKSDHYAFPLTVPCEIIRNQNSSKVNGLMNDITSQK